MRITMATVSWVRLFRVCLHPLRFLSTILLLTVMMTVFLTVNNVGNKGNANVETNRFMKEERNADVRVDAEKPAKSEDVSNHAFYSGDQATERRIMKASNLRKTLRSKKRTTLAPTLAPALAPKPNRVGMTALLPIQCEQDLLLVILVASSPGNFERRRVIRETWSRDFTGTGTGTPRYRTVFLLGWTGMDASMAGAIYAEWAEHRDMLIGNYVDVYRNLTLKVLHAMTWASVTCQAKFVLKTDDDCYVDPDIISDTLLERERAGWMETRLYVGFGLYKAVVVRDPTSRWYVPREVYPFKYYPAYASGFGYIMSAVALYECLGMVQYQRVMPVEDAYMGVLASHVGIPLVSSLSFVLSMNRTYLPIPCSRPYVIHGVTSEEGQHMHYQNSIDSKNCIQANEASQRPTTSARQVQNNLLDLPDSYLKVEVEVS